MRLATEEYSTPARSTGRVRNPGLTWEGLGWALILTFSLVVPSSLQASPLDRNGVKEAIAAYRASKLEAGDALAARYDDRVARTALEWVALRTDSPKIDFDRVRAFGAAHPDWPAQALLRRKMEARLHTVRDPSAIQSFFVSNPPETAWGKLALAWSLRETGRVADAVKLARAVFRENDLNGYTENVLTVEFGNSLTKADYKYKADRLLYKDQVRSAMRYAAQAGPDVLALAKARAAVRMSGQAIAAVPDALRKDPGLILAEVRRLRSANRPLEAAWLIESAPHDATRLIDTDEWWDERRLLARKLLDAGKVNAAYIMCAMNAATSPEAKVEAEFHAGWIALRFMHEPARATYHFTVAEKLARTPTSIARIAYWQGRAIDASDKPDRVAVAKTYYGKAAAHASTYHGQLARQVLGLSTSPIQEPAAHASIGDDRAEAIRVVELLYDLGDTDDAFALAIEAANNLTDAQQVSALTALISDQQDAHSSLVIGKLVGQRGLPADLLAFPTFGIPAYEPTQNSASPSVVYSVARQESAFVTSAVSRAGAKGLMQMIEATARHTAAREHLPFDRMRLLHDAAFNARLGAAHLGELIAEQNGSLILTFAAYNAGGGRVKQWIDAYGDPRKPDVDPVDWIERIPFGETRNYVQRVLANVVMYEAIFAEKARSNPVAKSAREAHL